MREQNRRSFLKTSLETTAAGLLLGHSLHAIAGESASVSATDLHLGTFRFDVSPPMGHPLCGGWIKPVVGYDDRLEALGLVLLGAGKPIVLCAVDWTGILNEAHLQWREALAEAVGTTPDRVAVQCVHQHNAPFACLGAEAIVEAQGDLPHIVERDFFRRCLDQARSSAAQSVQRPRRVTHIAHGQGQVQRVASNRRILGPDGKVQFWRGSSTKDPKLRELPEGLIDPWLKTIAFYDHSRKIAACHYYATHPMSYYGDGRVSSDFAGLARKRRQAEEPECLHIYFTGCAGNIAAGKYNDGSKAARVRLTEALYQGLVASEQSLTPRPVERLAWRTREILPPPRDTLDAEAIERQISTPGQPVVKRNRPAYMLSFLRRCEKKQPIVLSALEIDDVTMLHLPAECFVEYQLRAQAVDKHRFVATAAYGDGGPWYIPTAEAYPQGGYEVSVAFCDPKIDPLLDQGIRPLLLGEDDPNGASS